jgi:hypothetical protein
MEELRMLISGTGDNFSIGEQQVQGLDIRAEASTNVVILSVYVTSNRTRHRHELRARHHRREPAPRFEHLDEVADCHASSTTKPAIPFVEIQQEVQVVDANNVRSQRAIAIAPPHAPWNEGGVGRFL